MHHLQEDTPELVPSLNLSFSPEPSLPSIKEGSTLDNDQGYYFINDDKKSSDEQSAEQKSTPASVESEEVVSEQLAQENAEDDVKGNWASNILDSIHTTYQKDPIDTELSNHDPHDYVTDTHESEDIGSDITEDSLNNAKSGTHSSINTAISSNQTKTDEPLAPADPIITSESIDLGNATQLIDDISFPHLDITSVISGVDTQHAEGDVDGGDSMDNTYTKLEPDDKYLSDDFETVKTSDKTMISDGTFNSRSDSIPTEISSTTKNVMSDANDDSKPNEISDGTSTVISRSPSPRSRSPSMSRELEQRLIDIDDSLKDLREAISRSPVLELVSGDDVNPSKTANDDEEDASSSEPSTAKDDSASSDTTTAFGDHSNEENKENISSENVAEKNTRPDAMIPAAILPIKIDMKIRGKKVNENFPLGEIYPKVDSEQMDVAKFTASNYIRDYAIDYNKKAEAEALRQKQLPSEPEVSTVFLYLLLVI